VLYVNHFSPRGSGVGCDADASYPTYGERICRPDKALTPHPAPAQFCKTDDTSSCVYGWCGSPIPKFDNPKMNMMPALQLFGAGR
ncbi:alpha-D-ribose 1-methylphosphonate 5-phosphate C-P-lyase PhnJ, partial [Escherichia coli]|nr:alpha-D-ribose 1-methylphosphonate 5-phosphate C-P-lyase PhnJ [Escherichia coli]